MLISVQLHGAADAIQKRLEFFSVFCLSLEFASEFEPSVRCCCGQLQMSFGLGTFHVKVELLSV